MRLEEQTGRHLLLAVVVTVFSVMLSIVIVLMSWELWIIPLIITGNFSVWFLHIARVGSKIFYENLCAGLMMAEFFFFGVHRTSLFELPAVACIMILTLFMLNKKWMLHMIVALYLFGVLYHALILHTVTHHMEVWDMLRLVLGFIVTLGGVMLASYWISRREVQRAWYENVVAELEKSGRQNAVFLSNVSHELRTPINMVIGISEVILGKDISSEIRTDMLSIKMAGKRLSN